MNIDCLHRTFSEQGLGKAIELAILRGLEQITLHVTPVEAVH
jgi:hypothetical protein